MIYTISFSIDTQKADPVRDCRIIGEIGSELEHEDIAIGAALGYGLQKLFEGIRENVKRSLYPPLSCGGKPIISAVMARALEVGKEEDGKE